MGIECALGMLECEEGQQPPQWLHHSYSCVETRIALSSTQKGRSSQTLFWLMPMNASNTFRVVRIRLWQNIMQI